MTGDHPRARESGGYWHHQRRAPSDPAAADPRFQDRLPDAPARLTDTDPPG